MFVPKSIGFMLLFLQFIWPSDNQLSGGYLFSQDGSISFSLRAPDARNVNLILFEKVTDFKGNLHGMEKKGDFFSVRIIGNINEKYYGYQIENYHSETQEFSPETIIADPYSLAVATQNHYSPINKTLIYKDEFDWGDDQWLDIPHRDLIIYEAHIKDMTAHSSANCTQPGTYTGFHDNKQKGGIQHLKDMGYNAVEFLPIFEFGNVEIPFMDSTQSVTNTWNPYAANHWGYMPSFFFAPEGNYASDTDLKLGAWNGTDGRQVVEFKQLVKSLHKEGIAVILDVVYNHVSQYDNHPLKQIQRKAYFRQTEEGTYSSISGCGNDIATENEDMRQMIIESVLFWMQEYHINGFRFDLGRLIDWETIEEIRKRALEVNPNVFLTCEPWGGGYDPVGFSDRGWSSWNDQFRNAFKGWHPDGNGGFIFGRWHHDYDYEKIQRMFMGSHRSHEGQYVDIAHSVNYLESHDDHTLGDFIRVETGIVIPNQVIKDIDSHAILSEKEIAIHKIAAMVLLTSQGAVMIAQGQEWGRSKVIAETHFPDPYVGKLDHNSYEKDNETNWLNWEHKEMNAELVDFYRFLIHLRKENPVFRQANPEDISFLGSSQSFGIGYHLHLEGEKQAVVILNSSSKLNAEFQLPNGGWELIIQEGEILSSKNITKGDVSLPPISCSLFIR